nr:MAG TPA: hypothetical protein [Caudoviricetes sp.]
MNAHSIKKIRRWLLRKMILKPSENTPLYI